MPENSQSVPFKYYHNLKDLEKAIAESPRVENMIAFRHESVVGGEGVCRQCAEVPIDRFVEMLRYNEPFPGKFSHASIHEYMLCNEHKFYLDIEPKKKLGGDPIEAIMDFLRHKVPFGDFLVLTRDDPEKWTYHIIGQFIAPRQLIKIIADGMNQHNPNWGIDVGVYSAKHSLRCALQPKLKSIGTREHSLDLSVFRPQVESGAPEVWIPKSLITATAGCPVLSLDLLADELGIVMHGATTKGSGVAASNSKIGDLQPEVREFLNTCFDEYAVEPLGWTSDKTIDAFRIIPNIRKPVPCFICDRCHENDNYYVIRTARATTVHCFRGKAKPPKKFDTNVSYEDESTSFYNQLPEVTAAAQKNAEEKVFLGDESVEMPDPSASKLTLIEAPMGSGKTTWIEKAVARMPKNARVVIVTNRRTLAAATVKRFKGFGSYMDKMSAIDLKSIPRLVIQVDSMARIVMTAPEGIYTEYLILDEIESILNQLTANGNINAIGAFVDMVNGARHVIGMDGLLHASTDKLLCKLTGCNAPARKTFEKMACPWDTEVVRISMANREKRVSSTVRPLLCAGKHVACHIAHAGVATDMAARFRKEFDGKKKILVFTGRDMEMIDDPDCPGAKITSFKRKHSIIRDGINEFLKNEEIDLFIYTSTITAGVDICVDWFDTFVHMIDPVFNPYDTMQAISRVRRFRDGRGTIYYVAGRTANHPDKVAMFAGCPYVEPIAAFRNSQAFSHAFRPDICALVMSRAEQLGYYLIARESQLLWRSFEIFITACKKIGYRCKFVKEVTPIREEELLIDIPIPFVILKKTEEEKNAPFLALLKDETYVTTPDTVILERRNITPKRMMDEKDARAEVILDLGEVSKKFGGTADEVRALPTACVYALRRDKTMSKYTAVVRALGKKPADLPWKDRIELLMYEDAITRGKKVEAPAILATWAPETAYDKEQNDLDTMRTNWREKRPVPDINFAKFESRVDLRGVANKLAKIISDNGGNIVIRGGNGEGGGDDGDAVKEIQALLAANCELLRICNSAWRPERLPSSIAKVLSGAGVPFEQSNKQYHITVDGCRTKRADALWTEYTTRLVTRRPVFAAPKPVAATDFN